MIELIKSNVSYLEGVAFSTFSSLSSPLPSQESSLIIPSSKVPTSTLAAFVMLKWIKLHVGCI